MKDSQINTILVKPLNYLMYRPEIRNKVNVKNIPIKYIVETILDISQDEWYQHGWYQMPDSEGYYTIIGEKEKLLANQRTKDLETISDYVGWPVSELRQLLKEDI